MTLITAEAAMALENNSQAYDDMLFSKERLIQAKGIYSQMVLLDTLNILKIPYNATVIRNIDYYPDRAHIVLDLSPAVYDFGNEEITAPVDIEKAVWGAAPSPAENRHDSDDTELQADTLAETE